MSFKSFVVTTAAGFALIVHTKHLTKDPLSIPPDEYTEYIIPVRESSGVFVYGPNLKPFYNSQKTDATLASICVLVTQINS